MSDKNYQIMQVYKNYSRLNISASKSPEFHQRFLKKIQCFVSKIQEFSAKCQMSKPEILYCLHKNSRLKVFYVKISTIPTKFLIKVPRNSTIFLIINSKILYYEFNRNSRFTFLYYVKRFSHVSCPKFKNFHHVSNNKFKHFRLCSSCNNLRFYVQNSRI